MAELSQEAKDEIARLHKVVSEDRMWLAIMDGKNPPPSDPGGPKAPPAKPKPDEPPAKPKRSGWWAQSDPDPADPPKDPADPPKDPA